MTATQNHTVTIDMDTVKLIAAAAAREAVEVMREEMRRDADTLKDFVDDRLVAHFGATTAADHIIQHSRIDKLLNFIDGLGTNIFGTIIKHVLIGMGAVGLLGYVVWTKFTSG